MCTRFDSEVNSHTSTRKLVTTLVVTDPFILYQLLCIHGLVLTLQIPRHHPLKFMAPNPNFDTKYNFHMLNTSLSWPLNQSHQGFCCEYLHSSQRFHPIALGDCSDQSDTMM